MSPSGHHHHHHPQHHRDRSDSIDRTPSLSPELDNEKVSRPVRKPPPLEEEVGKRKKSSVERDATAVMPHRDIDMRRRNDGLQEKDYPRSRERQLRPDFDDKRRQGEGRGKHRDSRERVSRDREVGQRVGRDERHASRHDRHSSSLKNERRDGDVKRSSSPYDDAGDDEKKKKKRKESGKVVKEKDSPKEKKRKKDKKKKKDDDDGDESVSKKKKKNKEKKKKEKKKGENQRAEETEIEERTDKGHERKTEGEESRKESERKTEEEEEDTKAVKIFEEAEKPSEPVRPVDVDHDSFDPRDDDAKVPEIADSDVRKDVGEAVLDEDDEEHLLLHHSENDLVSSISFWTNGYLTENRHEGFYWIRKICLAWKACTTFYFKTNILSISHQNKNRQTVYIIIVPNLWGLVSKAPKRMWLKKPPKVSNEVF